MTGDRSRRGLGKTGREKARCRSSQGNLWHGDGMNFIHYVSSAVRNKTRTKDDSSTRAKVMKHTERISYTVNIIVEFCRTKEHPEIYHTILRSFVKLISISHLVCLR